MFLFIFYFPFFVEVLAFGLECWVKIPNPNYIKLNRNPNLSSSVESPFSAFLFFFSFFLDFLTSAPKASTASAITSTFLRGNSPRFILVFVTFHT